MASVVGKTIFSDGKGKLHFGYYKTDDAVEFVDYKTWKKLSFKDVSKGDTNKQRVIKAIVKNQKQFNKKVDFNMWAKKQKRSFEDTMDWFIQNGWINNINKGGIKESIDVLSVNEKRESNMFYVLYQKKGAFGKPAAAGYKDRKDAEKFAKSLGNNHNTMILDKQSMKNVKGVDVKESINEVAYKDAIDNFNKELEKNSEVKKAAKHYKKSTKDIVRALQTKIKVNRYSDKSIKKVSIDYKEDGPLSSKVSIKLSKDYKQNESVNESASKEAMGIAALTGTRGSAVQDFIDKNRINSRKLFNALKKANLQGRINFASALAGKPGNPNEKLTIKLFGEDKGEVVSLRKQAKSEKAFYDVLDKVEKKYGKRSFEKWLDKSLKDLKINPSKYRTSAEKQEALYQAKL